MTPAEQRTQTQMANLARENLHRNCNVDIRAAGPHWGLYCANPKCKKTNSWISWISKSSSRAILKKSKR
jgi:hypothetical protein